MDNFLNFIKKALSSGSDVSSKRLISLLAFVMMVIAFLSNLYFKFTIEEHMFKSMEWIVEIGMGTILIEKFSKKKDESTQPQSTDTATPADEQTPLK